MAAINSAFNLISGALEADQSALNIVANNVANANTPGYTQQVPNWRENTPVQINGVSYGTGVSETGATSVRDRVLEERLQQQQQAASASTARLSALDSVQALFPPDSGVARLRGGRHRRRHHGFLFFFCLARSESNRQFTAGASAVDRANAGG